MPGAMRALFSNDEENNSPDVKPLLFAASGKSKTTSSSDGGGGAATTTPRGSLGSTWTIPSPPYSPDRASPAAALVASPAMIARDASSVVARRKHPLYGAVARGAVLPRARGVRRERKYRKDERDPFPRHRHLEIDPRDSPAAIALKDRSGSGSLPTSCRYRSMRGAFDAEEESEIIAARRSYYYSYDGRNLECVDETDADGADRCFRWKPSQVNSTLDQKQCRARKRASTYPGMSLPHARGTANFGTVPLDPTRRPNKPGRRQNKQTRTTKSAPVDVDSVPRGFSIDDVKRKVSIGRAARCKPSARDAPRGSSRLRIPSPAKKRRDGRGANASTSCRSAPTGTGPRDAERARMDVERLLSQMGMDVPEEDRRAEDELGAAGRRRGDGDGGGSRCRSYDCNYDHLLDRAYEDFGVERELAGSRDRSQGGSGDRHGCARRALSPIRSAGKLVRRGLANIGNVYDRRSSSSGADGQSPRKHQRGVLSFTRGKGSARTGAPEPIVISVAASTSEDREEIETTLEDARLMCRWQAVRGAQLRGRAAETLPSSPTSVAIPRGGYGGRNVAEDALSVEGSCGDKTLPMDNRRRRHASRFSI